MGILSRPQKNGGEVPTLPARATGSHTQGCMPSDWPLLFGLCFAYVMVSYAGRTLPCDFFLSA